MTISIGGLDPQPKTEFGEQNVERAIANAANKDPQGTEAAPTDVRTTLLAGTASIAALTQMAMNGDDTRAGKVEQLRQQVSAGTYKVEPARVADALLGEWQ